MTAARSTLCLALTSMLLTTGAMAAPSKLAPQNTPVPASQAVAPAADATLGIALLAASVGSDGTLLNGSGATGVTKLGTGIYQVDFVRDVTQCFYNAASFTSTVPIDVEPRSGDANGVFIVFQTLGSSPTSTDSQFYMTVYCSK